MSALDSLFALAEKHLVPVQAMVELTTRCNLRCCHCYVDQTRKDRLTFPVLMDLLDQMVEAGTLQLNLTGGEIGLRPDLFEILAEARQRHFHLSLLSNGTLWGEPEWDRLADLGVQSVRLSVYGVSPDVHDAVTGVPGSLEKTMATAKGLKARGLDVGLSCSIMKLNAHEVPALAELAEKLDLALGLDHNLTLTDEGSSKPKNVAATPHQLRHAYGARSVRERLAVLPRQDAERLRPCSVGDKSLLVRATGEALPCSRWPEVAGSIFAQPFLDIFRKSSVMKRCRQLSFAQMQSCRRCAANSTCQPCPGMNLAENGTTAQPTPLFCDATAARISVIKQHQ